MISHETFAAGMALLAGVFGRNADANTNRAYYRVLSPKLDDAGFERAIGLAIEHETYWPAPAVLLARAGGGNTAEQELDALMDDLRQHGGHRHYPHSRYESLSAPVRAGIRAVGGLRELDSCTTERLPWLTRKFVRGYESAAVAPAIDAPRMVAAPKPEALDPEAAALIRGTAQLLAMPKSRMRS